MKEVWKVVEENKNYQVSNLGRVQRIETKKVLKPGYTVKGYNYVVLSENGKTRNRFVHRLVAIAFLEIDETRSEVNHKDGNKNNNVLSNLEWANRSENVKHAFDTKLKFIGDRKAEKCPAAKLNWEIVRKIRELRKNKLTYKEISEKLCVNKNTIVHICKNRTWVE